MFKSPSGMKDILPNEFFLRQGLEDKAKEIFNLYGYQPIATPILEDINLFNRGLGNETEIVRKQMFAVKRTDEEFVLRPEGTAAVVRAYLENNLDKNFGFMKLYYMGPMFRAERPQKGRLRQFHHIGLEALGADSPYLDSEVILIADRLLKAWSISGYTIKLNSLGCARDKDNLKKILQDRLRDRLANLCAECSDRFDRNILRVLDCKNEECKKITAELKLDYKDYLCADCQAHFDIVRSNLDSAGVVYASSISLVRGLDYYSRTVFEITHPALGATQDAIGAGGRYDRLIAELGGPELGAIGFAFGVERLLLATAGQNINKINFLKAFVITLGDAAKKEGFKLLNKLRQESISADMDYEGKSLKSQMRKANDAGVKYVLILGDNELSKNMIVLKDMVSGEQKEVGIDAIYTHLR